MPSAPYEQHYGLKAHPFSIAPDPRYIFFSTLHKEALAHLLYGLGTDGGGIVLLTGGPGTGKTMLCRGLLEAVGEDVDVAFIDDPEPEVEPLLGSVCGAFGVATPPQASVKQLVDRLNVFLQANHSRGRRSVLMIDEAQSLGVDVLEQLRLLTNLETHERKLLQILLVARPELHALLERHDLRQLAQRVIARWRLRPLDVEEVADYVHHRMTTAGGTADMVPRRLARLLHGSSRGVPRTINLLCDRALLGASLRGQDHLEAIDLQRAAQELGLPAEGARAWRQPSLAIAATIMLTVCAAAAMVAGHGSRRPVAAAESAQAESSPHDSSGEVMTSARDAIPPTPAASKAMPKGEAAAVPLAITQRDFTWPENLPHPRSAAPAYAGLLQRWGAASAPRASPCAGKLPDGLRCMRSRAGLAELKALNLPVVLHLDDGRGRHVDALLSRLEGDELVVEVAGVPRRLSALGLHDWWHGEYTMVWRAPQGHDELLLSGSRGPAIAWLRERLARWSGDAAAGGARQVFDAALLRQVRAFQMSEGLEPDGIVGVKTLARLVARTDPAAPTLGTAIASAAPGTAGR
jgi:general secretion pathway protein A